MRRACRRERLRQRQCGCCPQPLTGGARRGKRVTAFEKVLFVAGTVMTVLASLGLCLQVYAWRLSCAPVQQNALPASEIARDCR